MKQVVLQTRDISHNSKQARLTMPLTRTAVFFRRDRIDAILVRCAWSRKHDCWFLPFGGPWSSTSNSSVMHLVIRGFDNYHFFPVAPIELSSDGLLLVSCARFDRILAQLVHLRDESNRFAVDLNRTGNETLQRKHEHAKPDHVWSCSSTEWSISSRRLGGT